MKKKSTQLLSCLLACSVCLSTPSFTLWASEPSVTEATAETTALYSDGVYYYATMNMPYADFYYGELNSISLTEAVELHQVDPAASYREEGVYDVVSSATTSKSKSFPTTYYEDTLLASGASGVNILGIKDVAVAIPIALYDSILANMDSASQCQNHLFTYFQSFTFLSESPKEYKVLSGDGSFSELRTSPTAGYSPIEIDSDASGTITTISSYGTHQISLSNTSVSSSEMLGVVLKTTDGLSFGLTHLDNLWLKTGELSFAVLDFTEIHGNQVSYKKHVGLVGKTISQIIYIVKDKPDVLVNVQLPVKPLLTAAEEESISFASLTKNSTLMTTALTNGLALSHSYDATISSMKFDNTTIDPSLYTLDSAQGLLTLDQSLIPGTYTVVLSDDVYEDVKKTFLIQSPLLSSDINFLQNKLIISGTDATLAEYIAAINSVTINGTVVSTSSTIGSTLLNTDGSINFAASVTKRGTTTVFFPNSTNADYTLLIKADGYPSIEAVVGKSGIPVEIPSTETPTSPETPVVTPETPVVTPTPTTQIYGEETILSPASMNNDGAIGKISTTDGSTLVTQVIPQISQVVLSTTTFTYNGKTKKPSISVIDRTGTAISSDYYTVTYPSSSKKMGTYEVNVSFTGKYSGSATSTYSISTKKPSISLSSAKKRGFKVAWAKVDQATGYAIEYSTSSDFSNSTIKNTKSLSKSLTGLTKNTTYFVRLKTYKTVKTEGKSIKVYSDWSKVKAIKTKKK